MGSESKEISIIELEYHSDNIYYLVLMFNLLNDKFDIKIRIYTVQWIYDKIKDGLSINNCNIKWYIKDENLSKRDFIFLNKKTIDQSHLVIINTALAPFDLFHCIENKNIALRLHNLNNFLFWRRSNILSSINWSFREIAIYFFKEIFSFNFFQGSKILFEKTKYILISEDTMKQYLNTRLKIPIKKIVTLPLKVNVNRKKDEQKSPFRILIPTSLSKRKGSVKFVNDVLENLKHLNQTNHFELIFTDITLKNLNYISSSNIDVKIYDRALDQLEYESLLISSNCIFAPIPHKTNFQIFEEYYGLTKSSAVISDIAISSIPLLIHKGYFDQKTLNGGILEFSSPVEAAEILSKLANDFEFYNYHQHQIELLCEKWFGQRHVYESLMNILI